MSGKSGVLSEGEMIFCTNIVKRTHTENKNSKKIGFP